MRLLLGVNSVPSLLVEVDNDYTTDNFRFHVVNGAWDGRCTNGYLTIYCPTGDYTSLEKVEILSDSQCRLRGDYNNVMNEFNNVDDPVYVRPVYYEYFDDLDDDIPF